MAAPSEVKTFQPEKKISRWLLYLFCTDECKTAPGNLHECSRSQPETEPISGTNCPLFVKTRAVVKRFLCSDAFRRQSSVQIGTPHRFLLRHSLRQEYGEAPDECVSCASAVHALDHKGRHMLAHSASGEHGSVRP